MDIQTCDKYLKFIYAECERHLKDGVVTDDELHQLIAEFSRFQENICGSELPEILKSKLENIHFEYNRSNINKGFSYYLFSVLTIGAWAIITWLNQQNNRVQTLKTIQHDTEAMSRYINLNH